VGSGSSPWAVTVDRERGPWAVTVTVTVTVAVARPTGREIIGGRGESLPGFSRPSDAGRAISARN
jgi:hypothetical protein